MGMDIFTWPHLDIERLKNDEQLNIKIEDAGYLISLKDDTEACVCTLDLEQYQSTLRIHSGSGKVLRHLAEMYDLLLAGDGCMDDAGGRAWHDSSGLPEDAVEILFGEYATKEMIKFKDYYGWSDEFIEHLKAILIKNREEIGVKESYQAGDLVIFEYCGPDNSIAISGRVVFVDDEHIIVNIPFNTKAADFNRDCLDYELVEQITGTPVSNLKKYEYDRFVDLKDPATYLPYNTFGACIMDLVPIIK